MPNPEPPPFWTNWNLSFFPDAYGPLYGGASVEEAVYRTLQTWLPAYIAEINRQLGGEILSQVLEYRYRPEDRPLSAKTQAAILVTVSGTDGRPDRTNSGYRSSWKTKIQVIVYGPKDWKVTQAITYAYGAAVRAAVCQNAGLGGLAESTTWVGEEYLRGETTGGRTSGEADIDLLVVLSDTMNTFSGVTLPSLDAPDPLPLVTDFDVELNKEEIGTDLSWLPQSQ